MTLLDSPATEFDPTRFISIDRNGSLKFSADQFMLFNDSSPELIGSVLGKMNGLRYNHTTANNSSIIILMPDDYSGNGIYFNFSLTNQFSTAGNVVMNITCYDDIAQKSNQYATTATAGMNGYHLRTTGLSGIINVPSTTDMLKCIISRDVDNGSDTFTEYVDVISLQVEYTRNW